ncbi:MAG: hypothetical protein A3B66_07305 [Alphaproteobacteria bacterium RIFCSPHIGHO2_02_FULL_46_13]|nr:MAG: hypothetical protein A3B66_07305 [Alphaproteobacteria bacterium RIFCSPHIGHO2_02_FULL_46_13]
MQRRKILLYGSGNGREHATLRALKFDHNTDVDVRCLVHGTNALMLREPGVYSIKSRNDALSFAEEFQPDNVLILSPTELIAGDADFFSQNGYNVFGASQKASLIEHSKVFSKKFMMKYHIPTPDYYAAQNLVDAETYLIENWSLRKKGYVLKKDIFSMNAYDRTDTPDTLEEAITSVRRLYNGAESGQMILEERISGYELSLHILVDGSRYYVMPAVQDYKKLFPNDLGPMTHGVAAVATSAPYPIDLYSKICKQIIEPTLEGFIAEKIEYKSLLYIGLMIENGEPRVLEYNVRSGNPEWLSLMGLLDVPFMDMLDNFGEHSWKQNVFSLTSFGLAAGYPETPRPYYTEAISGLDLIENVDLIGESILSRDGLYYPSGGRVFALRSTDASFDGAQQKISTAFNSLRMNGVYYRNDLKPLILQ